MVDEILNLVDGKERRKYAKTHGCGSLINMYHGLPWNDAESERVYKICNQQKITWEDYYRIHRPNVIY